MILDTKRFEELGSFPLEPSIFEEKVNSLCEEVRNILEKEWLSRVADIFLELKHYWKQYIPKKAGESLELVESFFRCVNSLMSLQLRGLVMRSLNDFLHLVVKYKVSEVS